MGRRGVALNTSLININNMSAYYNNNQIAVNNHLDITGNTVINHNLSIDGTDDINHNNNIVNDEIIYTFNKVQNNRLSITNNSVTEEIFTLNLYIGNTYIFDQSASSNYLPNDLIILSKKKIKYNRTNYNIIREPYTNGVSYFYGNQYNITDSDTRTKIKFVPYERGVFYLVSKVKSQFIRTVTINVLDNVYKYGSFITNSGFGLTKNLNVAGNMNVKDGMLYIVNDPQYIQPKAVGVGTTVPRLGLDMTNLTNYNDALKLPKTIGLGTSTGVDAMVRFNEELKVVEGYLEQEWVALGKVQDRDKDTFIDPEISPEREDELEFSTNGHKRLTMLSDDLTLIGIATTRPTSTLEINGNLNVVPDGVTSGVDLCNDTSHTDNYLHINITNSDKNDKSFDFKTNNGGYFKEIQTNLIETVNNKTSILTNNVLDVSETYKLTTADNSDVKMNSNNDVTIIENFTNLVENTLIETIHSSNSFVVDGDSNEFYKSSFNTKTDGNYLYNVNKTKYFNVIGDSNETYNINLNTNVGNNTSESIVGNHDYELNNFNFETYNKNYTRSINYNNISSIQNNFNTLINTNYNLNIKGNTTETYLHNFSKSIKLYHNLDIYGVNDLYINNNNTKTYNNDLNINNSGFLNTKITINKNNNVNGNVNETYNNSVTKFTYVNNTKSIYKNNTFNQNNSYYYNVTSNKDITVIKNQNVTINQDVKIVGTGSADSNKIFNSYFEQDVSYNSNRISNLVVYNENDKFINEDSVEIYKKNKFNYLWLFGHPLSGPNTVSFEVPNVFLTNYIKIVYKTNYDNTINFNPTQYVFPGYNDVGESVIAGQYRAQINDWFIFRPSATTSGAYAIINSYNSNISASSIDTNNEYYVLGPNDENSFAIILKNNYDPNQNYVYEHKFIMGPRKHQLEYNLTTHYVKMFNIGTQTTNISLITLDLNQFVIQQHTSHDIQQNLNSDISHVGTTGSNENSRFIFIYIEGTQVIGPHDIVTKSKYYIYSKQEDVLDNQKDASLVGYLCNGNNSGLNIKSTPDDSCIWTIEAVNPDDASYNVDLYYIYNTNSTGDHYIQFHSNNTEILLTSTKDNQNTLQHFTFYYYYKHFTNITSQLLTYNDETRAHYLTKDFKYIYSHGNTDSYISSTLDSNNKHIIGANGNSTENPNNPFLLIYNNTITIPGSGTDVGTFKIFNTVTQEYLFNDRSLNWVLESIEEINELHENAVYTIKAFNDGNPTHFLYNNNNVLDYTPIIYPILDAPKFSIINVVTDIPPGSYNKKVYNSVSNHIAKTHDLVITGNVNETYKSDVTVDISSNFNNTIKNQHNINVYQDDIQTLSKSFTKTIAGNLEESIFGTNSKILEQDYSISYDSNNSYYISGNLTENITGNVDKTINGTNSTFILNNTNETYNNDYTVKSSDNTKTVNNNVNETLGNNLNLQVDKSLTVINNSDKNINTVKDFTNVIGLNKNINVTNNVDVIIKGNKNISTKLNKVLDITNNKSTNVNGYKNVLTHQETNIDYKSDKTDMISQDVNTIVSGDSRLNLNNNDEQTYLSSVTGFVDNNLNETIYGSMQLDVTDDTTFNDSSDFNLSCAQNINLNSQGYVLVVNDITNSGHPTPSDKKSLVVHGGTYFKKDCTILGDILINNTMDVIGQDTVLKTEDYEINDPLIALGMLQEDDSTYSGILTRTYINSQPKFTGLVRNSLNTYALLNDIDIDSQDAEEYSNSDMNSTYSNLHIDKHANFVANKIISHEPNINTHGDLYISKNIFVGIVDTPEEDVENSFTLNIGTNINASQNTLKFTSNKDILCNANNTQDINITSSNDYNISAVNNRHIHILNNFIETVNGTYNKTIENISTETYNNNYNINISNNFTKLIKNNYNKTINKNYNKTYNDLKNITVKHDNNVNILQNSITKLNSDHSNFIGNSIENLYSDSHNILYKNKNLDVHNNNKLDVNGTNKLDITLNSNETYHNTNKIIHNNLTETLNGSHTKKIYQNVDSTVNNDCKETYDSDVTIDTNGSETLKVFGNSLTNINNTLNRRINQDVTETFKINYNVTISENLNSIISGSYNINVTNNTLNTFKKNVTNIIGETLTNTYNKSYIISVYDNNFETFHILDSIMEQKYDKNIGTSHFITVKNNSKNTIKKDNTVTNNKYLHTNIDNNSLETYGNTYDKYISNNISDNYRHNKKFNILNNYQLNNNSDYNHFTVGISTSTFRTTYNLNLDGNLTETFYSNVTEYIKTDNYLNTQNNHTHFTKENKSVTINNDLHTTINGYRNITINNDFDKSVHQNNDTQITGDLAKTENSSVYTLVNDSDKHIYNNASTKHVIGNLQETYDKTLTIIHDTGIEDDSITNLVSHNSSVTTKINNNYTKNIYIDYDKSISVNLNRTVVGDTIITNNKSTTRKIFNNKNSIINNNFIETVYNNVNTTFKSNKAISISQNDTQTILYNLNNTVYDDLNETYLSSKFIKKGVDNSTLTNYINNGSVYNEIKETYKLNIKNDTDETFKANNTTFITQNKTKLINGVYDVNITQSTTETFKDNFDVIQGSNTSLINNMYSKYIDKNTFETFKADSSHLTNNNSSKYIGGTYNLTSIHSSKPNINITTAGNLNITADANINKNNNVNFVTRVGIKDIVSYTPQIIDTATITDTNISEYVNSTNEYIINPKTVNIIYIDNSPALTDLINNNRNIFIRLNLPEAAYNGQIVKIIVHPIFESTFDINDRLSKGLVTNIAIRINSFCDANENEYVTVDLLLNRGGMGLSLIYVDNDTASNSIDDSYWMLMNNSFIYE